MNLLRNRPLLLLAAIVGLTCGLLASAGGFVDLQVYRFGGGAVIDGRLYDQGTPGSGLPFTYPPFAALTRLGDRRVAGGVELPLELASIEW